MIRKGAVDILYTNILRALKSGSKFYSSIDSSINSTTNKRKPDDASKKYGYSGVCAFSIILPNENQSKYLFHKGALQTHSKKAKKSFLAATHLH